MSALRFGQHASIHLGDGLRLALEGQRTEDIFRPRFREGRRRLQQHAAIGFLDPTGRLASAYPRGLPIGVVSEARQSDANTYKNVLVVPWVDLGSFANVVILTGGGTS